MKLMKNTIIALIDKKFYILIISFMACLFFANFNLTLEDRLVYSIKSYIKTNHLFRGVIVLYKDNKLIFSKSYLHRNIEQQQFLVASLVKQITSALILIEVGKGTINLQDKANKYLLPTQKIQDNVTIIQLLSHTSSGKFKYSNIGYITLGYILENVTHKTYEQLVYGLLHKLNMSNTFLIDNVHLRKIKDSHKNFIPSKIINNGLLINGIEKSTRNCVNKYGFCTFPGNACGGLISTAIDLNIWNYALHNKKVLDDNLYNIMITPVMDSEFPEGKYCCGICKANDEEFYHIGYIDGYKSTLSYFPRYKISLIILENISSYDYKRDFLMHRRIRSSIYKYIKFKSKFSI